MTDYLSHWDFADSFSAREAAALILGLEPTESGIDEWRVDIVFNRIKRHFSHAMDRHIVECLYPTDCRSDVLARQLINPEFAPRTELASVTMNLLLHMKRHGGVEGPFHEWLANTTESEFPSQKFSRHDLDVLLQTIGLKSVYQFDVNQGKASLEDVDLVRRWPWGIHHTELLAHLEAAARKFWVNYDPADSSTAPTNDMVIEWLMKERRVSKNMANSIATMLRPDGLPPGIRR